MGKITSINDKQKEKEFSGFIYKIKIDKKTDIPDIEYSLENEKNGKTITLRGKAEPLDSFLKAMQDLAKVFCEICDIDKIDETTITTVNFSEKGGIVISGQIELSNGIPQPLCLNTPHIMIEENEKYSYNLPNYAQNQLKILKNEAIKYIQGEVKTKPLSLLEKEAIS